MKFFLGIIGIIMLFVASAFKVIYIAYKLVNNIGGQVLLSIKSYYNKYYKGDQQ